MKTFAISYNYTLFPKYDRVVFEGDKITYFEKNKKVTVESKFGLSHFEFREPQLGIDIIKAKNEKDAFKKLEEKVPYKIERALCLEVIK